MAFSEESEVLNISNFNILLGSFSHFSELWGDAEILNDILKTKMVQLGSDLE